MLRKILAISINTFRETIRDKILYNLLFFALLMIASSIILSSLTLGEQSRIIIDIGIGAINIFGILISIFIGIGLVNKEIEKRTILSILSKPIKRYEFILAKYIGLFMTLMVNMGIMVIGFFIVILYMDIHISISLLIKVLSLISVEFMVITSVALMFSTFTTSTLSAIFTLSIYIIGHLIDDLKTLSTRIEYTLFKKVFDLLYYLLPNLENLNIKDNIASNIDISVRYVLLSCLYGLLYTGIILLLSMTIFQRREFR